MIYIVYIGENMARRESKVISTRLAPELNDKVDYFVEERGLFRTRSELCATAIREYINYLEAKESGKVIEADLRMNPQRSSQGSRSS